MSAPNIVVIVTDDQPMGLLDAMPITRREIKKKGVTITHGIAPSPLCSMSRAALLTGKFAGHELGVWGNTGPDGGWQAFSQHEDATLATALADVGYQTGLIGKYINGWAKYSGQVPPGWDVFRAMKPDSGGDGAYYNYTLTGTGSDDHFGSNSEDYSTDVLAEEAETFILGSDDRPVFLYFAPYGSHAGFAPAPRHIGTWDKPVALSPAVNASNVNMSPWLQDLPEVDEEEMKQIVRDQHETIMSVDDAVGKIIAALTHTGRIGNTLFVFLGDNGLQRGEHRLMGKYVPYQGSTHLQMLLRWDKMFGSDVTSNRLTTNNDLAATIVAAAGAELDTTGIAFPQPRIASLLEGGIDTEHDGRPAYIGWRTNNFMWCEYADGGQEFFDYTFDQHELNNALNDPRYADKIKRFKYLAHQEASPKPPGF